LIYADVFVRHPEFKECSFEDWWVDPIVVSPDMYKKHMRWETL